MLGERFEDVAYYTVRETSKFAQDDRFGFGCELGGVRFVAADFVSVRRSDVAEIAVRLAHDDRNRSIRNGLF